MLNLFLFFGDRDVLFNRKIFFCIVFIFGNLRIYVLVNFLLGKVDI